MKIFKYEITAVGEPFHIDLPEEAVITNWKIQGDRFQLWALVNPEAPHERRSFILAATGQDLFGLKMGFKTSRPYNTEILENGLVFTLIELSNSNPMYLITPKP